MDKLEKILIATRNPAKKERYGSFLLTIAGTVLGLNDLDIEDRPSESGETAEENAEIKAKFYVERTNLSVFSEDEALYVDFLSPEEQPGVHVRRINGRDEVDDEKLFAHWNEIVSRVPKDKRTGRWHIAYCLAMPGGTLRTLTSDHPIVFFSPPSRVKIPGWPMSSLEGPVRFEKPHSELTEIERQQLNQEADTLILNKLRELLAK